MTMYKCNSSLFCRSVWVPCLTIFMYVIQAINCLKKELLQIIINFIVRRGGWRSWGIIKILIFGWRYNCLQKVWVVIYSKLKDPKIGTFIFWKSLGGGRSPSLPPPHRHAPVYICIYIYTYIYIYMYLYIYNEVEKTEFQISFD